MNHILLVDDDTMLTGPLRLSFENAGYRVSVAHDGHVGLSKAITDNPDVVILDVMLPGLTGWEVCSAVRLHSPVPIIMLTALDDSLDRIKGLELGADDYLVKPFGFQELHAHVKAMLRRVNLSNQPIADEILSAGDIRINLAAHTVKYKDELLALRQKEYDLLVILISRLGQVVTRQELFDQIWGTDWLGDTRTLDVHISWLRNKVEEDPGNPRYLFTVRGVGYRFEDPKR